MFECGSRQTLHAQPESAMMTKLKEYVKQAVAAEIGELEKQMNNTIQEIENHLTLQLDDWLGRFDNRLRMSEEAQQKLSIKCVEINACHGQQSHCDDTDVGSDIASRVDALERFVKNIKASEEQQPDIRVALLATRITSTELRIDMLEKNPKSMHGERCRDQQPGSKDVAREHSFAPVVADSDKKMPNEGPTDLSARLKLLELQIDQLLSASVAREPDIAFPKAQVNISRRDI